MYSTGEYFTFILFEFVNFDSFNYNFYSFEHVRVGCLFHCLVEAKLALWTLLRLRSDLQSVLRKGDADIACKTTRCSRLHNISWYRHSNSRPDDFGHLQFDFNFWTFERCK